MSLPLFKDRVDQMERMYFGPSTAPSGGGRDGGLSLSSTLEDQPLPDSLEQWRARVEGESKEFVPNGWELGAMEDYIDASVLRYKSVLRGWVFVPLPSDAPQSIIKWQAKARAEWV